MSGLVIAAMRREDIDEVMEIERGSFAAPWPAQLFLDELDMPGRCIDVLREQEGGPIVGFINYLIVEDELHVLNVATRPAARMRGVATRLLDHVAGIGRAQGAVQVGLEVRRSNRNAIRLYRRHGYRFVGIRPRYYEDNDEDALLMTLDLAPPAPNL